MATNTRSSRPLRLENLEGRLTPASASPMQWPIGEVQQAPVSRDVVFVDEYLLDQVPQQELVGRDVITVNGSADAISQISAALAERSNVGVIRLISHGESGALLLGNQVIDQRVLASRSSEIASWGSSLAPGADLLVYGCSVASTEDGVAFTNYLSSLTGADVAASTNLTGAYGGDTSLEYSTGLISHSFGASQQQWEKAGLQLVVNDKIYPNQRIGSANSLTNGTGQEFPNLTAFALLNRDGSVTAWGNLAAGGGMTGTTGVPSTLQSPPAAGAARPLQLYSNERAFAALMDDGSLQVWGDADYGVSNVPASVTAANIANPIIAVYSTKGGFAALRNDNSIDWWYGSSGLGITAQSSTKAAPGGGLSVNCVFTTQAAFCALLSNNSLATPWGEASFGGVVNAGKTLPTDVTLVVANQKAFAALGTLGGLPGGYTSWGDAAYGGNESAPNPGSAPYSLIAATEQAFAFVQGSTVETKGNPEYGARSYTGTPNRIIDIVSTSRAFCVIYDDGTVGAWGPQTVTVTGNYGGDGSPTSSTLGAAKVVSTSGAFAAFDLNNNLLATWGNADAGGTSSASVSGGNRVATNGSAFAALNTTTGIITTWGVAANGGTGGPAGSGWVQVFSNNSAFTALKNDGTVFSWGNTTNGGQTPSSGVNKAVALSTAFTDNPWFTNALTANYLKNSGTYSFNLKAYGFPGNLTYTIGSGTGASPTPIAGAGVTLSPTGVLTVDSAAAAAGIYTIYFNAASKDSTAANYANTTDYAFTLTIGTPAIFASPTATGNFTVFDVSGSIPAPIMTEPGVPVAGFSLAGSGSTTSVPGWVNFNATTGAISGTPTAGSVGTYTFTITAANTFGSATQAVTLNVAKATQTVNWTDPAAMTYGALIGSTQLNASVSIPAGGSAAGAVTYQKTAPGTVETVNTSLPYDANSYTLLATAAATADYNAATKQVTLVINKADQAITWGSLANIVYGDLVSSTQLNATVAGSSTTGATSPGALSYARTTGNTPGTSIAINDLLNAGSYDITVTAAATNNYNAATKTQSLLVNKFTPTITWPSTLADITYGTLLSATQLDATVAGSSTSGATTPTVTVYTVPPTPGTVVSIGTLLNAGKWDITVTSAESANYNGVDQTRSLTVNKADQTITWVAPLADIVYGDLISSSQLNATVAGSKTAGASNPGALSYERPTNVPVANGDLLDAGTYNITVTAAATSNYNQASTTQSLTVLKADPTISWSNPANIIYGTLLNGTQLNAQITGVSTPGATLPGALVYNPASGTLLDAGKHILSVTSDPTNNYNSAFYSVNLAVDKANQTIDWSKFTSPIIYGTLLTNSATDGQLNATVAGSSTSGATDPGALSYSRPTNIPVNVGDLLDAGDYLITVDAAETSNYLPASETKSLTVNKAEQTITWARPSAISYGTVLSAQQLNASVAGSPTTGASDPGALTYTPATGALLDAGLRTLSVTAAATPNYNEATYNVQIQVNRIAQTITWANPADITYGTLLDATQLNATASGPPGGSLPGALTYSPATGALLDAGQQTLTVTAAATSNYLETTNSVTLVVNKADQNISWANPGAIVYGTKLGATQLNASVAGVSGGSAPGELTYTPGSGTVLNAGSQTLNVIAAATTNYNEANKSVTIVVNKADQNITWATPTAITYGTLLSSTQLNAIVAGVTGGSAPGALTYTPATGTLLDAGSQLLSVTAAATDNYNEANKSVSLLVNKAPQTITWANPANVLIGTKLSSTQLNATVAGSSTQGSSAPGALTYNPVSGTVMNTNGPNTLTVTAAATPNYLQGQKQVTLVVDEAPSITSANNTTFTVGTTGNFQVTSTGYPARTYSETGTLPSGVTFNTATGVFSGNAAALSGGKYNLVLGATNGISPNASQNFILTVNEAPTITSGSSVTFLEGIAGTTFQVTSIGFPAPTFALTTGKLPTGLSLNPTTGLISGTPAEGILGSYPVTITATNSVASATKNMVINVWRNVPTATGATLTTPFDLGAGSYVVSLGNGSVLINNPNGQQQTFAPFPGFTGTLSTSLVDRNGDGTADSILVAVAKSAQPAVLVLDAATGKVAYNFYAFDPGFFGGVTVAGGITKFQGKVTTVVLGGAGPGAEPSVSAFDAVTGQFRQAFYAFAPQYSGGVRVAMSGPDATGQSLIVASPAINSNIVTFTLDEPNRALSSFYAFIPPELYQGTWVAAGDLNRDGISELVVGAGPGTNGKAEISVFDLKGNLLKNFLAFSQGFSGGVSVAVSDYNKDGIADIFASSGAGAKATFNVFNYADLNLLDAVFLPTDSLLGTFVANNPSAGSTPVIG